MRGYESAIHSFPQYTNNVTNPHEGLWDYQSLMGFVTRLGYESPWGVMSVTISNAILCGFLVTNPHEGLWEECFKREYLKQGGLRIPMRGYESASKKDDAFKSRVTNPHEGLWGRTANWFPDHQRLLRIPMRGYEWLNKMSIVKRKISYESPWGVMSQFTWIDTKVNP